MPRNATKKDTKSHRRHKQKLRPGTLVPSETMVIAVTLSLMCVTQPKCPATSPMTAVSTPMHMMLHRKAGQPPSLSFLGEGVGEERAEGQLVYFVG